MSHSEINRRIVLTSRPKGTPVPGDFLFEEAPVPAPAQGGVLLRTLYLSLDPYMRGMMNERAPAYTRSIAIGEVMPGGTVSRVITSDNPRKENPDAIINEVEKGFRSTHYEKIADRTEAIRHAAAMAQARDLVLIAGKGHEKYQEFADHTIPFDDIQVARRALDDLPVKF